MSRSKRKIPIIGITTAESDKPFKVREHRRERRAVKIAVSVGVDGPDQKAFGNPYHSEKDGKQFWDDPRAYRK